MQFEFDLKSPHAELFKTVRNLLLSLDGVEEVKKPRITTYRVPKGGLCHLRTMPYGVDVGFLKGAKMADKPQALSGNGKAMRVLQIRNFDETLLRYYLEQATKLLGSS